ncbi:Sec-dependent nitrous-oxide reductase [Fodinisporobacter ferrooxydans]|uniref:Sec-dependent nitrous-oxide reductase n=1 Tax=Fodinisporobacter ferrooxydans TaxID=2901836 RepID=A0ABY4CNN7_9BACL|nr:Sec-dependent nitrous-oxide reductase [Alicyclobacillaceae bacterium MYW30-H2]
MRKRTKQLVSVIAAAGLIGVTLTGCASDSSASNASASGGTSGASSDIEKAALATYVPFGQKDKYYMFASGGHSGQVYVVGVPSMRRIRTIPVFTPDPGSGYGFDDKTKAMLDGFHWGDVHHPALSETNGKYDGRWLFVNDNANNRAAMIDLKTFTTEQVTKPIPNISGPHCAAFVTPNSEYFMMPTRFSVPPNFKYSPLTDYDKKYSGMMAAMKIDPKTGHMNLGWELQLPPWDYDLSDEGKGPSNGWAFITTYNTEEATTNLEVNASQKDRDYTVMVNWKAAAKAAADPKNTYELNGAKVLDPTKVPGLIYLLPTPKSPHGVDVSPDGKYIVASGKLSPTVTVFSFDKIQKAIDNKDFAGMDHGLPILKFNDIKEAEVNVGLGPLHTQFDGKGYAYTTLFIDSAIVKWKLGDWKVVDKIGVNYAPGHSAASMGDSAVPDGKYLVSLNKIAKDDFLPVGPSHPVAMQLIDISGPKMKLLYTAPIDEEPHYAQIAPADLFHPINVYPKDTSNPAAIYNPKQAKVVRNGNKVEIWMTAIRSHFTPDNIQVNEGDQVTIHLTNLDRDESIAHGFAIESYDINEIVEPGQTKTFTFTAKKAGVYPFYCTNFCSALHQEMQGYLLVKPSQQ